MLKKFKKIKKIAQMNEKDIDELFNAIMLKASDNGHQVPILSITVDLEKYNRESKGSCTVHTIMDLHKDEHINQVLRDLIDYIRQNYDCNEFVRCSNDKK